MPVPVLYETHSHTPLCKHAKGLPTEYAAIAQKRGLLGLTVTCHNPMPSGFSSGVRMSEDQFPEYLDLVTQTRNEWVNRVDVLLGLEADYFEGHESYVEQQLQSADFQYVLGSVHPQIGEFRERYWSDDPLEVQRTYFRLIAQAAETKLFDSMAHPDLVKNETVADWDTSKIMPDICRALDRVAATGVAMELNTSGRNKRIREMNPFPAMLKEMNARGIPVTIGADAHVPERVADNFGSALDLLAECGYSHVSYFVERKRVDVSTDAARASLRYVQPAGA
ncbi:MAG: histidinol-phosphatase [Planctomycetota bacterium]